MRDLELEQEGEDLERILQERAQKEEQAPSAKPEDSVMSTGIREFTPLSPAVTDLAV
ncbi:MAG: hypothetical protein NTY66_00495 [Candidatus Vogelbacteria bacterium]|nr:hypothetical protein [Candidatus Vogelbacteria bacterium]